MFQFLESAGIALRAIWEYKLRSFLTVLGNIVAVTSIIAVVSLVQGMNAYVKENIADAMIGSNTFQVRRTPINIALIQDDEWSRMQRRKRAISSAC